MTVQELIKASLRAIGAIATGETPTADELADGLEALNALIQSWSQNRNLTYYHTEDSHTLTAGTGQYTMGSGLTISTTKPVEILRMFTRGTGVDVPIDHRIGEKKFYKIATKTTTGVPNWCYVNWGTNFIALNLFPVPASALTLYIYSIKALTTYTALTTTISHPEGYERALRWNLAIELAPEYGKEPSAAVIRSAAESKREIEALNAAHNVQPVKLDMISASTRFNINAG